MLSPRQLEGSSGPSSAKKRILINVVKLFQSKANGPQPWWRSSPGVWRICPTTEPPLTQTPADKGSGERTFPASNLQPFCIFQSNTLHVGSLKIQHLLLGIWPCPGGWHRFSWKNVKRATRTQLQTQRGQPWRSVTAITGTLETKAQGWCDISCRVTFIGGVRRRTIP